jgi:uncharacterized protein (TIGR03067 family)
MKRSLFAILVVVYSLVATLVRADDLKTMEGKWKVESAEAGGKALDSPKLRDMVVTITGDRYEALVNDSTDRGSISLDETKSPKTVDSTDTEGEDAGKVLLGIYELKGDTLRVCYAIKGGERPTEFVTKEGSTWLIITYRREK